MTFDDTGAEPEQIFEMHPDPSGVLEYATKYVVVISQNNVKIYSKSVACIP